MTTIINVEYDKIDEEIEKLVDSDEYHDEDEIIQDDEQFGKDAVVVSGPAWRVTDRGLIFMEGVYCNGNEETGELEPDWGLTLIYADVPDEEFNPTKWIYLEQDPPATAIHNYLFERDMPF